MATPDIDIATQIGTDLAAWTLGTNLFHSPPAPPQEGVPVEAVFVYPRGGEPPYRFCGEDRWEWRADIGIRIRGDRDDYTNTLANARALRDAVNGMESSLTDYIQIRAMNAEPIPLGLNDQGCPEYQVNVEALYTE